MTTATTNNGANGNGMSAELAYQQALKYGQDLKRTYVREKARREELEIANQMMGAIFDSTPEGMLVLDEQLIVKQANPALCQLLELTADDVIGRCVEEILPESDLISLLHRLQQDEQIQMQMTYSLSGAIERSLLVNVARLAAGSQQGWVLVIHDQTERKQLEYQKTAFINIAAHELRTPLTSVLGLGELLAESTESRLSDDEAACMDGILNGAQRLKRIIDQIVAFAEISRGGLTSENALTGNLRCLLEEVCESLNEQADANNVMLNVEAVDEVIDLQINVILLRSALYQLILNAINFNCSGGEVWIQAGQTDEQIWISIEDNGQGIPKAELEEVVKPFFQVEDHSVRHVGGLGLGLPIVKRAVMRLGGEMDIESKLGEGTRIHLMLPVETQMTENNVTIVEEKLALSHQQTMAYAQDIQQLYQIMKSHFIETLTAISEAQEARDPYTRGHSKRVTDMSLAIGKQLELGAAEMQTLERACLLHDIGKLGVEDAVLFKADGQPTHEYAIIQHIEIGQRILEPLAFLEDIIPIALAHHERYDGQGLPYGLAGNDIPLEARIMAVVNDYDTMTSPRPHREALSHQQAMDVLRAGIGREWDPAVVVVFEEIVS